MTAEPVLIIELNDWGIFLVSDENTEVVTVMTDKMLTSYVVNHFNFCIILFMRSG